VVCSDSVHNNLHCVQNFDISDAFQRVPGKFWKLRNTVTLSITVAVSEDDSDIIVVFCKYTINFHHCNALLANSWPY
jgi:hypothetical protein